jgi:hypothetical protein
LVLLVWFRLGTPCFTQASFSLALSPAILRTLRIYFTNLISSYISCCPDISIMPSREPASFSSLPGSIRRKIFRLALLEPRIILTNFKTIKSLQDSPWSSPYRGHPPSYGGHPTTLHINQESRQVFRSRKDFHNEFECYINFNIDTLYIEVPGPGLKSLEETTKMLWSFWTSSVSKKVKHLALDWKLWDRNIWCASLFSLIKL